MWINNHSAFLWMKCSLNLDIKLIVINALTVYQHIYSVWSV